MVLAATTHQEFFLDNPDQACAECQQEIYNRYQKTPMARASGIAADGRAGELLPQ